jgi:hypothetical protein
MIQPITHEQATELTGDELPDGYNWYQASGLQFYPEYGDFRFVWQAETGLSAIIGKRKQQQHKADIARIEAADKESEVYPF